MYTCGAVSFSLFLSWSLLELHFTEMYHSSRASVQSHLLTNFESEHNEGFLGSNSQITLSEYDNETNVAHILQLTYQAITNICIAWTSFGGVSLSSGKTWNDDFRGLNEPAARVWDWAEHYPSSLAVTGLGAALSSCVLNNSKRRYISLQNEWMNEWD